MTHPFHMQMMLIQANALFRRGEYNAANPYFERVIDSARLMQDHEMEMRALSGLAASWGNLGNFPKQAELSTRMLNRARALHQDYYIGDATLHLSYALGSLDPRNYWPTIRKALDEGMAVARTLPDTRLLIFHLIELSKVAVDVRHKPGEVRGWLTEAISLLPPISLMRTFVLYRVYRTTARLWQDQDAPEAAWKWGQAALEQAKAHGGLHVLHDTNVLVAELDQEQGRPEAALHRAEEIVAASVTHKWRHTRFQGLAVQADALLDLKRPAEEACKLAEQRSYPDHAERAAGLLDPGPS